MAPPLRKQPHIVVLGSLNMDLVSYVPHHPAPGETLTSNRFAVSPGGKGANQAVACPGFGFGADENAGPSTSVAMVGCVGDDSFGAQIRANLARHGVDVSGVAARQGLKTGLAVIIVDEPSGQNRIVLSPEANYALQPAEVASAPTMPAWLRGASLAILQLELLLDTVVMALCAAQCAGVPVLFNPAPMRPDFPLYALATVDHLVVNEGEAAMLASRDTGAQPFEAEDELGHAARLFVRMGVKNVVITLGERGVYFLGGTAGKTGLVTAVPANVVDTTAAGDAFVGQYALEVVAAQAGGFEFDIETAVRKANRAAARTVERPGAQDSIPWRDELW